MPAGTDAVFVDYQPRSLWQSVNATPDFPLSESIMQAMFAQVKGCTSTAWVTAGPSKGACHLPTVAQSMAERVGVALPAMSVGGHPAARTVPIS